MRISSSLLVSILVATNVVAAAPLALAPDAMGIATRTPEPEPANLVDIAARGPESSERQSLGHKKREPQRNATMYKRQRNATMYKKDVSSTTSSAPVDSERQSLSLKQRSPQRNATMYKRQRNATMYKKDESSTVDGVPGESKDQTQVDKRQRNATMYKKDEASVAGASEAAAK